MTTVLALYFFFYFLCPFVCLCQLVCISACLFTINLKHIYVNLSSGLELRKCKLRIKTLVILSKITGKQWYQGLVQYNPFSNNQHHLSTIINNQHVLLNLSIIRSASFIELLRMCIFCLPSSLAVNN